MKRFFKVKGKLVNVKIVYIIMVIFFVVVLFSFSKRYSDNLFNIIKVKIEEITKYYLNKTIKKYLNIEVGDYIYLNMVNNNIVSVDINNSLSNKLLFDVIDDLENNVKLIESGNILDYHNLEMIKGDNGIIALVPMGALFNNLILTNLGPKIPIKVNFLENVEAYLDVSVESYGINNSLVKLYIIINIEEVIEMPIDKDITSFQYKFLIASKLINGKVPSIYGGVNTNSSLVKSDVN